jgi:hypothetical protein
MISQAEQVRNVAGIAGVSESTIYNVIRGYAPVAIKTRERLVAISNRLKYNLFDSAAPVKPVSIMADSQVSLGKTLKTIGENPDPERYASSLNGYILKPKQCPYCKNIFTPDTYKQEICVDCKPRKVKENVITGSTTNTAN